MKKYQIKTIKIFTLFCTLFFLSVVQSLIHSKVGAHDKMSAGHYQNGTDFLPVDDVDAHSGSHNFHHVEIPKCTENDEIITHAAYTISYDEGHKQAKWVAYELTREETYPLVKRNNKFVPDPGVKTGTAEDKDYAGSGYDRGHLAPAGDMAWSSIAMRESFYYSNISPQEPGFNRGIWKKLEEMVREWARDNGSLLIVTGPVLEKNLAFIGKNRVSVPKYFYKVILDYEEPDIKGIGFILPNVSSNEPLQKFALTIDTVEKLTGIDFFYLLPDEQEELIESTLNLKSWGFDGAKSAEELEVGKAVLCKGVTRNGERCKNRTKNPESYCPIHEDQNNKDQKTNIFKRIN